MNTLPGIRYQSLGYQVGLMPNEKQVIHQKNQKQRSSPK